MRIEPGDHVLIPMAAHSSESEIRQLREQLAPAHPGVTFGLIGGSTMTHALVYRDEDAQRSRAAQYQGLADRYETALQLIEKIVGKFTVTGDVGGIGNVRRSTWVDTSEVERWADWVRMRREQAAPPQVEFCNRCPVPRFPDPAFHPGGGPEHREGTVRVGPKP